MADSINFVRVSKRYANGVVALRDVSFSIADGEFVFVIGESGAGKSTIVKLLTREEKTSSGKILLNNFDITGLYEKHVPYMRRKIGMIFQDYRLIDTKTVYENVAFAMEIVGAPPRVIARRVPIVLRMVGLKHRSNAYPTQLSGGEAQRVGIARAVVNNPRIILADEPTGNLDPANGESIMAALNKVNKEGTTVLCCTHDIELVRRMNHRVLEFKDGHLISDTGGGYTSLPLPPRHEMAEVQPNMDLERILRRRREPVREEPVVSASTIQDDIERILSRLPRREATEADETLETVEAPELDTETEEDTSVEEVLTVENEEEVSDDESDGLAETEAETAKDTSETDADDNIDDDSAKLESEDQATV